MGRFNQGERSHTDGMAYSCPIVSQRLRGTQHGVGQRLPVGTLDIPNVVTSASKPAVHRRSHIVNSAEGYAGKVS
jgi:hypothetical protein